MLKSTGKQLSFRNHRKVLWKMFVLCCLFALFGLLNCSGENVNVATVTDPAALLGDYIYMEVLEPEDVAFLYKIRPAKDFGKQFPQKYYSIPLVPGEPYHGCSPLTNKHLWLDSFAQPIVLLQRGECSFVSKAYNAQISGALAVIITNNDKENDDIGIDMIQDDTDRNIEIPAYFLLGKDGFMIKRSLEKYEMTSAIVNVPVNLTGVAYNALIRQKPPWTIW